MSNGIASIAGGLVLSVFLAASVSTGGCDRNASLQRPDAKSNGSETSPPPLQYLVDRARNRAWSLSKEGVLVHDLATSKVIMVALPAWSWVREAYACGPVLALGPRGEALITSNVVPTLWRIDSETLAVDMHPLALDADTDKDVGFSALVYSQEHGSFFAVSDVHGSLWKIDPDLKQGHKIPLSAPIRDACGVAAQEALARFVPAP